MRVEYKDLSVEVAEQGVERVNNTSSIRLELEINLLPSRKSYGILIILIYLHRHVGTL